MGLINRILMRFLRTRFTSLLLALVASVSLGVNANPLHTYNETDWLALNKAPAITSNIITSAVEYEGRLYITGQGLGAGGLSNQNIIAWDGDQWLKVPEPKPLITDNFMITSAVVHEGNLVISAVIMRNFGAEIRSVLYSWNGSAWRTLLEEPSPSTVFFKLHSTDAGLVVLVMPTNNSLYMWTRLWNGSALVDMPSNGITTGFSFATWRGQLYWAGQHQDTQSSDGNTRYGLLKWDGQVWKAVESTKLGMGGNPNTQVAALGNHLVLGGSFQMLGDEYIAYLAHWDGSTWNDLGGMYNVYAMDAYFEGVESIQQVGDRLIMLGKYRSSFDNTTIDYKLSSWDGGWPSPMAEGITPKNAMPFGQFWAEFQQQKLLFNVEKVEGRAFNSAAILGGSGWKSFDGLQVNTVSAVARLNGKLAVAGAFSDGSNGIAWREPSGWQQFVTSDGTINSLVEYQGNLIAAGDFTEIGSTEIGSVAAGSIALWNGTSWEAFAGGLFDASISKLYVFNDQVYAIGNGDPFDDANSAVLYWDGNNWVAPEASGTTISPSSRIKAAIEFNGQLVLGGNIGFAGSSAPLMRWDGTTLAPFAPLHTGGVLPAYDWVSSMAVYDGKLIAAVESFSAIQSMPPLAQWDGTSWNTFADINGNVAQVAVFDGELMALVASPPGNDNLQSTHELKTWNGENWSGQTFDTYKLGFNSPNLMITQDDLLIFAGSFRGVGFTDWSSTENAVASPGIIGLQSLQATITFAGEGAEALAPIATIRGTNITLPDVQRDHYNFSGWNTAADGSGTSYNDTLAAPRGTTTLYAQWAPVLHSITFVSYDNAVEIASYAFGASVITPTPANREGYSFTGWDAVIPATMPAQDLTFTAQWQINTYTISFAMNGGDAIESESIEYGAAVVLPTPVREGYAFTGWDIAVPETMPAQDLTFTAQWSLNTYTIYFVVDGGDVIEPVVLNYGATVTLPTPEREGYEFKGWDILVPETMPAQNLTFTALWQVIVQSSSSSVSSSSASSESQSSQASSSSLASSSSAQSSSSSLSSSIVSSSSSSTATSEPASSSSVSSVSSQSSSAPGSASSSSSSEQGSSTSSGGASSQASSSGSSIPTGGGTGSSQSSSSESVASSSSSSSASSEPDSSSSVSSSNSSEQGASSSASSDVSSESSSSSVSSSTSSQASSSGKKSGGGSSNLLLLALLGLCLAARHSKVKQTA